MKTQTTQLAVVGAGPGGYAAAFHGADLGLEVVLVDTLPKPGGVCTWCGCIPSKALLHVARVIDEASHAGEWGVRFAAPEIDAPGIRAWKDTVVARQAGGLAQLAAFRKVQYLQGRAAIVDARTLQVESEDGGTRRLSFEHAVLATGSRPSVIPGLPSGDPRVLDSTSALDLPDVPRSLLVIGGGYIGLELGTVYAALGSEVTVVEMAAGLLPGVDRDLVVPLARRMERICKAIRLETRVSGVKAEKKGLRVTLEGRDGTGDQLFDRVLVAVGRKPNSKIPGLDRTAVRVDGRGFIQVDERRRTHEPSLFAIGDVAGEPMLAHKAAHEARVAVEAIAGHRVAFEPRAIPAVVFTDPEIAWCGLTETQAQQEGRKVAVAKFPWGASGRASTLGRSDGVTKLVLDPASEVILGVGIAGPGAGELIGEGVLAIEMGATALDLKLSIHPHPTLSETLMEAADVFFGTSAHFYRPKREGKG